MDGRRLWDMLSRSSERGASAIVVAFGLILLLGVSAVAIDLGAGWNERRQDQTTADLAAVAGAISFGSQAEMVTEALTVARANLDTQYSDAEWRAMWQNCTDPGRTAAFVPLAEPAAWGSGTLDCISLSPSFFRVRVPEQETDTSFGKILGVETLSTDAYAVATVWPPRGAGALPFAVRALEPAGEICLDTGPSGTTLPPCDGPAEGSFGNIAPPMFGNPLIPTSPECDQQTSSNNHVAESIAMGIDHIIWPYPSDSWLATGWSQTDNTATNTVLNSSVNMDLCTEVTSSGETVARPKDGVLIDGVVIDTGNTVKTDVTEGLISASVFADGMSGRLWRSANTIAVKSGSTAYHLDNTPLWTHLLADGATVDTGGPVSYSDAGPYAPSSCDPANFGADIESDNAQMVTCLADYETGLYVGQIFDDTILDTPRFGVAPQLWHDNLGSGVSYRPVEQFRMVYVAGLWFRLKTHSTPEPFYADGISTEWCPVMIGSKCAVVEEVEQMTAYLLDSTMVSLTARSHYPGLGTPPEITIFE